MQSGKRLIGRPTTSMALVLMQDDALLTYALFNVLQKQCTSVLGTAS